MTFVHVLIIFGAVANILRIASAIPTVQISGSEITGIEVQLDGKTAHQFWAIPYAEPPVGPLRFQKPQPLKNLPPTVAANAKPPACSQYSRQPYPWYVNTTHQSEDCLYLNVFTPGDANPDNKKAVMYWIHGGGFRYGSSADDLYSGVPMATLGDIIVVTVNYRLGPFGFFTTETEDAPPNLGLFDTLLGLKWVHQNIESFGGDLQRITVAGESAGALMTGYYTLSPLTQGLFSRIIMESGSAITPIEGNGLNFVLGQKFAETVGCANETYQLTQHPKEVVECLKGLDADTLAKADDTIAPSAPYTFFPESRDEFLPNRPRPSVLKGNFHCKDLLFGNNKDEGSFLLTTAVPQLYGFFGENKPNISKTVGGASIAAYANLAFPNSSLSESIVQQYLPANLSDNDYDTVRQQVYTSIGDLLVVCPDEYFAEKCAEQKQNVYSYFFTHRPSVSKWAEWMGVAHFEELQFVFGKPILHPEEYQTQEVTLSRKMVEIWSNFVKNGKPDCSWPLFSKDDPVFKLLGPDTISGKTGYGPHLDNCKFLRKAYEQL